MRRLKPVSRKSPLPFKRSKCPFPIHKKKGSRHSACAMRFGVLPIHKNVLYPPHLLSPPRSALPSHSEKKKKKGRRRSGGMCAAPSPFLSSNPPIHKNALSSLPLGGCNIKSTAPRPPPQSPIMHQREEEEEEKKRSWRSNSAFI